MCSGCSTRVLAPHAVGRRDYAILLLLARLGLRGGEIVRLEPDVRVPIEAVGAQVRHLPPYSPDFSPIEPAFAKLKASRRAVRPRTFDTVCELIAAANRALHID